MHVKLVPPGTGSRHPGPRAGCGDVPGLQQPASKPNYSAVPLLSLPAFAAGTEGHPCATMVRRWHIPGCSVYDEEAPDSCAAHFYRTYGPFHAKPEPFRICLAYHS